MDGASLVVVTVPAPGCPPSYQHRHSGHYGGASDSLTPAMQVLGWMLGRPHPDDRLVPRVWACFGCGNQYLLPARCCGRESVERPLLFYWTALTPYHPAQVQFSLVIPTHNRLRLTQRAVSILARIPSEQRREIELIFVDGYSTDGTLEYIRALARTHLVKFDSHAPQGAVHLFPGLQPGRMRAWPVSAAAQQ